MTAPYARLVHDVVIVGAGAAGCVLASRLTEDPDTSVLLIEAGLPERKLETRIPAAFSRLYRTDVDWGYSTVPQAELDGREIVFPLGRVLGGSTAMNAMMVLRGHRADYDAWEASGCPGWTWADVEPLFARSAAGPFPLAELPDRHRLTRAFVDSAQAEGLRFNADLNSGENDGVGFVPVSQRRGRRFGVARGYLRPAKRRPNLTVLTAARATRVARRGRKSPRRELPPRRQRGCDGIRGAGGRRVRGPLLPSGHTNWPTVMIAERAADLMRAARVASGRSEPV